MGEVYIKRNGRVPPESLARRIGGWLPSNPHRIQKHVREVLRRAKAANLPIAPPIATLQNLLNSTPTVRMLFTEMLTEVPTKYTSYPGGAPNAECRTLDDLIAALNYQIQNPISWNDSAQIGTPINGILDWPMATKAGFAAFIRDDVNNVFQEMLEYWGVFLRSTASNVTITTAKDGWLSTEAQAKGGLKNFLKTYVVPDPANTITYGFENWDQFFTRQFLPDLRPIASPDDDNVIVSATESTPFEIQRHVQLQDTFWVKNQDDRSNYSLADMLGGKEIAEQFVGGTVYQAFLSADSYHNWHAPVSGKYSQPPTIINGTYYSEPIMWSFDNDQGKSDPDKASDELSQGYISAVAKRGVALIQADNPAIGLMAIVMIGMAEVSSVDFFENSGTTFKKGDPIGCFHFGGSTHCLIFGPNVNIEFARNANPYPNLHDNDKYHPQVQVKSLLATVTPPSN
ncbi:phosphatidylserine decarboxylase [Colletotrichum acutatum]|uniref:Phosphatidylserine decarboxylase n=1 Tax=Glomerella acutata TaxID=27357 RepID=A0AAD9D049_GLOAC|nr:phosphatidylserine decarboxylase [Colletotrichum acutatum]KAK1729175.1 phosphatidylserine decarboxylase [Colletotrichum acutatum]